MEQQAVAKDEKKFRGISGSTLKIIALVSMLIDHIGAIIYGRYLTLAGYMDALEPEDMEVWLEANGDLYLKYAILRWIGRIAFPIFCFLLVEGFDRTRDLKKYQLRLIVFAVLSEIPYDLAHSATVLEFDRQNVFFTLAIGLFTITVIERFTKPMTSKFLAYLTTIAIAIVGAYVGRMSGCDYGAIGVLCIVVLYYFRKNRNMQIITGVLCFLWELTAPFAFIPCAFYNGKRGLNLKYVFYAFYPLHLLLLYLIAVLMGIGNVVAV